MMFKDLNDDNFLLFAAKEYNKPNAVMSEFEEDMSRILYIKRLLTKYYATGLLKERLILNHIIVLYNVFGIEAGNRILFYKLDEKDYEVIKPFLVFLNYLPEIVRGVKGRDIITSEIKLNQVAINALRELKNG